MYAVLTRKVKKDSSFQKRADKCYLCFSEHQGSKAYDLSSLQLSDSNPMQKILGVSKGVLEVKNLPAMQESPV